MHHLSEQDSRYWMLYDWHFLPLYTVVNVIIAGSEHKCVMISLGLGLKNATATMETVKRSVTVAGEGGQVGG